MANEDPIRVGGPTGDDKDGGRDLPANKHSRTRRQRLFDAAHSTLTRPTINSEPVPAGEPQPASGAEVIHHGRRHRYATPAQVRGLIASDRGFVRCRVDVSECQARLVSTQQMIVLKLPGALHNTNGGSDWANLVRGERSRGQVGHGYDFVEGPFVSNPQPIDRGGELIPRGHQLSVHTQTAASLLDRSLR